MISTVRAVALFAALGLLATASPAAAATVSVRSIPGNGHDMEPPSSRVSIAAPSGERNVLEVVREPAGTWLIRDSGAVLTAATTCIALNAHSARCTDVHPLVRNPAVEIDSGDGDDVISVDPTIAATVRAGAGDDRVSASGTLDGESGDDTLFGGDGPDTLRGGAGRDVLRAGGGDDWLGGDSEHSAVFDDVIDGGEGSDTVFYGDRRKRLVIDLMDGKPDGERGERDSLRAVENVIAGSGNDVLRGNGAANRLQGSGGRDRIYGRGGDDTLEDGDGADVLRGGAGDDQLYGHDRGDRLYGDAGDDKLASYARRVRLNGGSGDDHLAPVTIPASVRCGPGRDLLSTSGHGTRRPLARIVVDDCERLITVDEIVALRPRRGPGSDLKLPVECRKISPFLRSSCRGVTTVRLLRRGRLPMVVGSGSYDVAAGTTGVASIAMAAARRRALNAVRRPLVDVTVAVIRNSPGIGDDVSFTGRWRVHLARRR